MYKGKSYGGSNDVCLTQAQYDALVSAGTVDPDTTYYITDDNVIKATDVTYGDSNVGGALDTLNSNFDTLNSNAVQKINLSFETDEQVNKPWVIIKSAVERELLKNDSIHIGTIYAGGLMCYWGYRINSYGSWIIQWYDTLHKVNFYNGQWSYSDITTANKTSF